jgi:hypothetical protein
MKERAAVTSSNENGLSRFRACFLVRTRRPPGRSGPPTADRQPTSLLPTSCWSIQLDLGASDGLGERAQAREPLLGLLAAG